MMQDLTDTQHERAWLTVGSLLFLATVALAVVLRYTGAVMIPFVIAVFIVSIVAPVVDYQVLRLKVPHSIAMTMALLIALAVFAVLCLLIVDATQAVIEVAVSYSRSLTTWSDRLSENLKEKWDIELGQQEFVKEISNAIPGMARGLFGTALSLLSSGFLVLIFVLFLLAGRNPHLVHRGIYGEIDRKIRSYIGTKVAISAVTGMLVWLVLSMFGLQLAEAFGTMAFLLNFIPSIGSVIATLLPIPIALAQFENLWVVVGVVAVPGAIQMLVGNVVEPKLMGEGLELHPVTVILALSFWGLLWGPVGAILAVPITAIIRIVLLRFETVAPSASYSPVSCLEQRAKRWPNDSSLRQPNGSEGIDVVECNRRTFSLANWFKASASALGAVRFSIRPIQLC